MSKTIDSRPTEVLVTDLIQEALDINELNLLKASQRKAFLLAIKQRPALLAKVSKENEAQFFKCALLSNHEYFVQLKRTQYTDELAQIYISKRLAGGSVRKVPVGNTDIQISKSLDEKTVFNYSYISAEGEELYYLDKELGVPLSLKSSIMLTMKLNNAVALIEKLDTNVTQLGEQKIKGMISDIIANQYKGLLGKYITTKGLGYYSLCSSLADVEAELKSKMSEIFVPYGIEVTEFVIKKIAIPKDIQFKLEDQAFQLRQRRSEVEADAEFAKLSLESYEAKLAIQHKYPEAEPTLTEYEKDLALKRYLTKIGRQEEKESIDHTIKITQKVVETDVAVEKKADVAPEIPHKPNVFKRTFIVLLAIMGVLSIAMLFIRSVIGVVMLAVTAAVFGTVGYINREKFKTVKIEPTVIDNSSSDSQQKAADTADATDEAPEDSDGTANEE
jgi:hypothetical protein